jgi:hypothetical protein
MHIRQPISVGNLLLDIANFRIVKQDSQKQARDAIIGEQGKKLVNLAKDIIEVGLNPFDLPLVIDAADGNSNYIVIEGNRRLAAIQLMLKPELADETPLHASFKKLNKHHADAIPQVMDCVIAPNREAGQVWIDRKHKSGLDGAGTDPWSAMSKARADAYFGLARPALDVVNFVLSLPQLDAKLRLFLEGSKFNITTLERLVEATEVQEAIGFSLRVGKVVSDQEKDRIKGILIEIVTIIAEGKHDGKKFTERDIDTDEHRIVFLDKLLPKHPKKKKAASAWIVSGTPADTKLKDRKKIKSTPTTEDQINLIPRKFKLELPAGKTNDIFVELKELDATRRRHAVSVLFRVFFDLTLDYYIEKHGIQLPKHKNGQIDDSMKTRFGRVIDHVTSTNLLSKKELKPINVARNNENSFTSPDTLNAYVHSRWMNPNPLELKISWANFQLFIERLWTSRK